MVFKDQRCLDCGLTGDVRLMSRYCHMESVFVHPGSVVQFHPKRTERYHDRLKDYSTPDFLTLTVQHELFNPISFNP